MNKKPDWDTSSIMRGIFEVFATILGNLARDAFKLIVAFAIGTGAGAIACWYYDLPLALSLLGGFIVLGIALFLISGSLFD